MGILDLTTGIVFLKSWSGTVNGVNLALTGTLSVNGSTGTTGTVLIGGSPASWSATPSITSWTTSSADTANVAGIAVTSTDGLVLANATVSTAGVPVQQSPRLRFRSNVWNTTVVAANNTDDWFIESVPVSGATPSGLLKFGSSLNGAATTTPLSISTASGLIYTSSAGAVFGLYTTLPSPASRRNWDFITEDKAGGDFSIRESVALGQIPSVTRFYIDLNGNVGLGTVGGTSRLTVSGDIALTTSSTSAGVVALSATAPTIASGFGATPSIVASNGTAAFTVNVGTGGVATGGVITMPSATTGWIVNVKNLTQLAANRADVHTVQTASTQTSVTVQNQTISTGAAVAWTASDILQISAMAY